MTLAATYFLLRQSVSSYASQADLLMSKLALNVRLYEVHRKMFNIKDSAQFLTQLSTFNLLFQPLNPK